MNNDEQILINAVNILLEDEINNIGLPKDDQTHRRLNNSTQFTEQNINVEFRNQIADLVHYESVCAAFSKVHSHKTVSNPTFTESMVAEMQSMAVPKEEQQKALDAVNKIAKDDTEVDDGYNSQLDSIKELNNE